MVQVADVDQLAVTVRSSGPYSPDVIDDLKRRVLELYQEALAFRQTLATMEPEHIEETLES